jgi:hypothetical protein
MAEKSFVNEFAETLGVAPPDELAAALEVALELLDDELPHPTAIADATAIRANARNRRENKIARSSFVDADVGAVLALSAGPKPFRRTRLQNHSRLSTRLNAGLNVPVSAERR